MEKNENNENKRKDKRLFIIIGSVLLLIILLILWFLLRRFDVTIDYNNGIEDNKLSVRFNKLIDEKEFKINELGENFIAFYEVIGEKDGKDILADKPYDVNSKVKKDIKLKAVYKGVVAAKDITISFDSKGGSKVSSITTKENEAIKLPKNPTRSGYTFEYWKDKDGKKVKNGASFKEDTTLYASWKGIETISISLTNNQIHRNGTKKSSKAKAKVAFASGAVTYSIDNKNLNIDKKTGDITFGTVTKEMKNGFTAKVTATLPSGKSASTNIIVEKDLSIFDGNVSIAKDGDLDVTGKGNVNAVSNQNVTWKTITNKTLEHALVATKTTYRGRTVCIETSGTRFQCPLVIVATTPAGQKIEGGYYIPIN